MGFEGDGMRSNVNYQMGMDFARIMKIKLLTVGGNLEARLARDGGDGDARAALLDGGNQVRGIECKILEAANKGIVEDGLLEDWWTNAKACRKKSKQRCGKQQKKKKNNSAERHSKTTYNSGVAGQDPQQRSSENREARAGDDHRPLVVGIKVDHGVLKQNEEQE
jgi:hypothetical protein